MAGLKALLAQVNYPARFLELPLAGSVLLAELLVALRAGGDDLVLFCFWAPSSEPDSCLLFLSLILHSLNTVLSVWGMVPSVFLSVCADEQILFQISIHVLLSF